MPEGSSNTSLFGRISARSSFIHPKEVSVSVQLLDDADTVQHEFKRTETAQAILDYVCECMNIQERDYFGLRYQDHNKHRYWVDLSRPIGHIAKQFKFAGETLCLRLRFRYYPAQPAHLKEAITRYQLFVQLQRDLLHGRLYCPQALAATLAALVLQSQTGDYSDDLPANYVSEYKLLLKQTSKVEERVAEAHRLYRGMSAEDAELEFLKRAATLDTYGFDPYTVKLHDSKESAPPAYVGVSHKGVLIYQGNQKVHHLPWNEVVKVDYVGKEVRIQPAEGYVSPAMADGVASTPSSPGKDKENQKKKDSQVRLDCPSGIFAKHLWTHVLSQQAFFNENKADQIKPKFSKPRIPLLSRGSTFRYPSRRVLAEIENDVSMSPRSNVSFTRYQLPKQEPRHEQPWTANQTLPTGMRLVNNNDGEKANGSVLQGLNASATSTSPSTSTPANDTASEPSVSRLIVPETAEEAMKSVPVTYVNKHVSSPTAASPELESRPSRVSDAEPVAPLMTSTPLNSAVRPTRKENGARERGEIGEEIETKIVNGNGVVPNGSTVVSKPTTKPSLVSRVTNFCFSTFLLLLLLLAVVIGVFENSGSAPWIENNEYLSYARHQLYEPARKLAVDTFNKYTSK